MQSAPDTSLPSITFPCRFKHRKDDQVNQTGIVRASVASIWQEPQWRILIHPWSYYGTVCIVPSSPLEASSTADQTKREASPVILWRAIPAKMCQEARRCLDPCLPLLLTVTFPYQKVHEGDYVSCCLREHWNADGALQTSTRFATDCRASCLAVSLENSTSPAGCSSLAMLLGTAHTVSTVQLPSSQELCVFLPLSYMEATAINQKAVKDQKLVLKMQIPL